MLNLKKSFTKVKNCKGWAKLAYSKEIMYFLKFLKYHGFILSIKKADKSKIILTFKTDCFGNPSLFFFKILLANKKLTHLSSLNRNFFYTNFNATFFNSQLNILKVKKLLKKNNNALLNLK